MAASATVMTDQALLGEFRRLLDEQHATWTKAFNEFCAKGEVSGEVKERMARQDAALAEVTQKIGDANAEIRLLKERGSRPPIPIGAPGASGADDFRSLGQMVVGHENFKGLGTSTRPRAQMALKGRIIQTFERRAINPFISEADSGFVIFPRRVGVFTQPVIPLIMRDLLDVVPLTDSNAVEYVLETWVLAADYQLKEGDRKAQSDVTYTDKTAVVRTIAHYVKLSRQMLTDVPAVRTSIDTRMVYGIALKEDKEILYGDGGAGHLLGIMPQATAYAAPGGIVTDNQIDQIYAAMVQVMQAGYAPSAIVVNPVAFAGMQLMKTAMGVYILGGPPSGEATPRLWGLPVAQTMNMAPTDFLVGAFPGNAALFDRETPVVEISFENEDDFVRNLATIRAEERITLAVYVPAAFVKGTLATGTGGATARNTNEPSAQHKGR